MRKFPLIWACPFDVVESSRKLYLRSKITQTQIFPPRKPHRCNQWKSIFLLGYRTIVKHLLLQAHFMPIQCTIIQYRKLTHHASQHAAQLHFILNCFRRSRVCVTCGWYAIFFCIFNLILMKYFLWYCWGKDACVGEFCGEFFGKLVGILQNSGKIGWN